MAKQKAAGKAGKGGKEANGEGRKAKGGKPVPRKIIYTAQVELIVNNLDEATKSLFRLVKEQGGYLAKSEAQTMPGRPRYGHWTVRVPVDHFDAFLEAVVGLGEMQTRQIDSDDITDRYYDEAARIKVRQKQEERLLELMKKSAGNNKDMLEFEDHLSRLRTDIEQMQTQLQRWDNQTALATVTVNLNERDSYIPPVTPPTYSTTIGKTFASSLEALKDFGKGLFLVIVALTPWLPFVALALLPLFLSYRRHRSRRRARATAD